jgi:hypothetical protein
MQDSSTDTRYWETLANELVNCTIAMLISCMCEWSKRCLCYCSAFAVSMRPTKPSSLEYLINLNCAEMMVYKQHLQS